MNRDVCSEFEELLIDFTDGALAGDEAARVGEHLKRCPDCRATVEALRHSLEAAKTIWQDNLHDVHSNQSRTLRSYKWRYIAAAASIALAVGVLVNRTPRHQPTAGAPTMAEIEKHIAESSRAARLLARVNQLESNASLRDVAKSQYRYIAERYPNTAAAESVHRKLESYE